MIRLWSAPIAFPTSEVRWLLLGVRLRQVKSASASTVPGIIDTMTAGFDLVNRIPWIIGLPILMDVFLWLTPRLSAATLVHGLVKQIGGLYDAASASGLEAGTVDQMRQALTAFDDAASGFNLLSLLVTNVAGLPSILPSSIAGDSAIEFGSLGTVVLIALVAELLGMIVGCFYFGAVAQQVRDGRVSFSRLGRKVWSYWAVVLGFIGLVLAGCVALSIPLGLAVGLLELVAPGVGSILLAVVVAVANVAVVLFVIYLFFLLDAIVVSEVGPIRAARNSARVVSHNFWSSMGFIGIILIISLGLQQIWQLISGSPIGTVLAIGANAYVSTGLAAASMLFYQSRVSRLPALQGVVGRAAQS